LRLTTHADKSVRAPFMKAIVVRQYGEPDVMKVEDVPTPEPSGSQVLVKIMAAGVNPVDTYLRTGNHA